MLCSPQEKNSLPSVPSHCPCHSHGVPLLRFRLVNCRLWWWPSLSLLPLSAPMPLALPCTHSRSPAKVSPRLLLFLFCHLLMSWAEPRIHPWPHHSLHSSLTVHITQLHNSSEFRKPTAICSLAPASEILSLWEIYQRLPIALETNSLSRPWLPRSCTTRPTTSVTCPQASLVHTGLRTLALAVLPQRQDSSCLSFPQAVVATMTLSWSALRHCTTKGRLHQLKVFQFGF